ncbi:MAG: FAD-dependent oxidoreductase [Phycisphaeraceae bacterium]|nr:FAD-dependent oxidoreductase [Phycisphaeraceae bacterium]
MTTADPACECLIFGGGAAGLFTLAALRSEGISTLLLERSALGAGQTRCAQGIIHGGTKYALGGIVGADSRAIAGMPERWLRMYRGEESPSLATATLRSGHGWLWASDGLAGRLGMLGASVALRTRPEASSLEERPEPLRRVRGRVLRLPEPIFDPSSVLAAIAEAHRGFIARYDEESLEIDSTSPEPRLRVSLHGARGPLAIELRPRCVILAAGVGNEQLRARFHLTPNATQRRPLHQVLLRSRELPWLDGHCVQGDRTRVTITSARDDEGRTIWHLGGQLAEEGVERERPAQCRHAIAELRSILPDAAIDGAEITSYRVDRAEPSHGQRRPDDACARSEGRTLSLWPTKLALAPRAAELALDHIRTTAQRSTGAASRALMEPLDLEPPPCAPAPWHDALEWSVIQ